MKRFAMSIVAASLFASAFSMPAFAQETSCKVVGKATQYRLEAFPLGGIPSFRFKMVSPGTACVTGKDQYLIKDATKPLDTFTDAESVIDALRTLNKVGFTNSDDISKLLAYVAEVEKADTARPKKEVADQKTVEPFSSIFKEDPKKK